MKNRLTFDEMQTFIEGVANETVQNGFGYKQFYIDYFKSKLYGEHDFGGTEENPRAISEVYEELYNADNDLLNVEVDLAQYNTILTAIDEEINHQFNLIYKPSEDLTFALSMLVDKISKVVDDFTAIDSDKITQFMEVMANNKDVLSSDNIVEAIKKSGLLKSKPKRKN